jgi:queuine tRNA-ribosyltransferase
MSFQFKILHRSSRSKARVGQIATPHGVIDTPGFVAVGTNGSVKALDNQTVDEMGLQLMFCNTYHLLLQPGSNRVAEGGGLHTFIGRKNPIITDSGGFQVFSLAYGSVSDELKSRGKKKGDGHVLKVSEEGVLFRSYRDGTKILLTPESSIQAQKQLGADIIIPLDELPPYHIDGEALRSSLERTHRWEKRSLDQHLKAPSNQAIYAVIHGGIDPLLRKKSAQVLSLLPFDGFAIGGSLGKTREEMVSMLKELMPHLPPSHPNHLLGIGDLPSIDACIPLGIDTFDSSYPTRAARHGLLLTDSGGIKVVNSSQSSRFESLPCSCSTCRNYSLAYLHHLFKASELAAPTLATIHNLHYMIDKMRRIREAILSDKI